MFCEAIGFRRRMVDWKMVDSYISMNSTQNQVVVVGISASRVEMISCKKKVCSEGYIFYKLSAPRPMK